MKNIYRTAVLSLALLSLADITPSRAAETVLYRFTGGSDGSNPLPGTLIAYQGALYGTTVYGGKYGSGEFFSVTPANNKTSWTETPLYSFTGGADGGHPMSNLIEYQGAFYGTTNAGGRKGYGTVFKLKPPAGAGVGWTERVLYNFCSVGYYCDDGAYPQAGLIAYQGALFGATVYGGNSLPCTNFDDCGYGTVFKLTLASGKGTPR